MTRYESLLKRAKAAHGKRALAAELPLLDGILKAIKTACEDSSAHRDGVVMVDLTEYARKAQRLGFDDIPILEGGEQ